MKKTLWLSSVLLSAAAISGCGVRIQQIESQVCESLVLREGKLSGQEAICLLRPGISPRDLLPVEVSGKSMSLRERLSTLAGPESAYQDSSGNKWFVFTAPGTKLEASCDQATDSESCRWVLRGTKQSNNSAYPSKLQETLDTLLRNGFQDGVASFESVKDPSPGEYVTVTVSAGRVDQIEWRHPRDTAGFIPAWAKAPK